MDHRTMINNLLLFTKRLLNFIVEILYTKKRCINRERHKNEDKVTSRKRT